MLGKVKQKIMMMIKPVFYLNKAKKLEHIFKQIDLKKYKKIIIFENKFGFSSIMKQRPQQMALSFPSDVLFIYHSNKDNYSNKLEYQFLKKNVLLVNLDLYRCQLIKKLSNYENKYLMIYSTNYIGIKRIKNYLTNDFQLIYEYVDNIDPELNGKKLALKLQKQFDYVIHQNHVHISTTASKLYDNVLKTNVKAHVKLITNGVDYEHFKPRKCAIPSDLKRVQKLNKTIVGYYGALASWFDYELIKKIVKDERFVVVLLGMNYDDTLEKSGILGLERVYYLGKKDYELLPNYVHYFDICMIPFLINDITLSTSPVKVFEYMASLKPIVTTDLPECRKYDSVLISRNHDEFLMNLEKAIVLEHDKKYLSTLKKEAMLNQWSTKCREICAFVEEK